MVGGVAYGITRGVEVVEQAPNACSFNGSDGPGYTLDPGQAQNAALVAAVGARLDLPNHAVTIALAAALQESHLRDLPYGDRDSVGLFQQRPSEGWGTRAQLLDPVYAATAFYQRLETVPGWQTLAVADAAQAVQRSADGAAYAAWAAEARTMAIDLTGEAAAAVSCQLHGLPGSAPSRSALVAAAQAQLGVDPFLPDPGPGEGWRISAWLVSNAAAYHLRSVSYADRRWTPGSGRWAVSPESDSASVQAAS